MYEFGSQAWLDAFVAAINGSKKYEEAARDWEGDFYFIITPEGSMAERVLYYMDLWHGKCRDAYLVADEGEKEPVFRMTAPLSVWEKVVTKKLDVIQGLLTRQVKLKGNMAMIMRNVKAAQELVECCTHIETEFPE